MLKTCCFTVALLALVIVTHFEKVEASERELDMLNSELARASSSLRSWVNDTFNAGEKGFPSVPKVCNTSEQESFKSIIQNLTNLGVAAKCTQRQEPDIQNFDIRAGAEYLRAQEIMEMRKAVFLPFRIFGRKRIFGQQWIKADINCETYAGAFAKQGNNLYSISSSRRLNLIGNTTASWYYYFPENIGDSNYSLLKNITSIEEVPGYKSALKEAEDALPDEENKFQEFSASNNAILFLPMLFSFVPMSLISDEISTTRTILYVIATDVISNIPIIIKGVELVQISRKATLPLKSVTFKIENSQVQMAEIWITRCLKVLPSFRYGSIFLLVGAWSIVVGMATEFITWKYAVEKEKGIRKLFLEDEEAMAMLGNVSRNQGADIRVDRMVSESQCVYQPASSAERQEGSQGSTSITVPRTVETDDVQASVGPIDEPWAIAFFLYGAILSILCLVPFLSLLLAKMEVFKKTKKREYFFKIGIIVGSLNTIILIIYIVSPSLHSFFALAAAIIFNIGFVVVLQRKEVKPFLRRRISAEQEPEDIHEREARALKFYSFGFILGLLTSLFSIFYAFCFPGIQGNETRERFFKYGCMVGAVTNIFILEAGLLMLINTNSGYYVFLYNIFFALFLILAETEILIQAEPVERLNKSSLKALLRYLKVRRDSPTKQFTGSPHRE